LHRSFNAVAEATSLLGKKTVPPPIQNIGNNTIGINSSINEVNNHLFKRKILIF